MPPNPPPLTPAAARAAADLVARALLACVLRSRDSARRLVALVLARGAPAVASWLANQARVMVVVVRAAMAAALARGAGLTAGVTHAVASRGFALPPAAAPLAKASLAWAARALSLVPHLELGGRGGDGGGHGGTGRGAAGDDLEAAAVGPRAQPPPPTHRHRAALVFLGGLVRVEVSVPRVGGWGGAGGRQERLSLPPPPPPPQAVPAPPARRPRPRDHPDGCENARDALAGRAAPGARAPSGDRRTT